MEDKRKFARFKAGLLLKFSSDESAYEFSGVVQDISMGGLSVTLDGAVIPLVNCRVNFYLLLPSQTFKISGEIAWVRSYDGKKDVGIRFVHIPDSYKEEIYNYISKYHRQELTQKWWQRQA
jgi:c-di-GMP-binding flagellar brake protein YcgR